MQNLFIFHTLFKFLKSIQIYQLVQETLLKSQKDIGGGGGIIPNFSK